MPKGAAGAKARGYAEAPRVHVRIEEGEKEGGRERGPREKGPPQAQAPSGQASG